MLARNNVTRENSFLSSFVTERRVIHACSPILSLRSNRPFLLLLYKLFARNMGRSIPKRSIRGFDSSPTRGTRTRPIMSFIIFVCARVPATFVARIIAVNYRAHAATHARALSRLNRARRDDSDRPAIIIAFREFVVTKRQFVRIASQSKVVIPVFII